MGCETTSGIGSRIFCLVEKAMWEALPRTIDCSSKPCSTDLERDVPGATYRSVSAPGKWSTNSRWAKGGVFERIFKLLAEDHDNEYMMIDATIVRAHQHSAGARKKTVRKPSAGPAAGRAPKSTRSPTR
jgi:transposase